MLISETFSQAVEEFKRFLANNNLPTEILWLFKDDTFSRNTKFHVTDFWVKLPLTKENEKLAERHYSIGQKKGFGISISALAICENKTCCSLLVPKDQEDSELLLISPKYLKFSFVQDIRTVKSIKSSFIWMIFRLMPFKYKNGNFFVYLESKKNLQFDDKL